MNSSQKGFIAISVILTIIALLLAGSGVYVYVQKKQVNQSVVENMTAQATSTLQASDSQTADWKIYTNTKYGFSFKYPSSWFIRETPDKTMVDFAKSELVRNDREGTKKIFLSLYVSDLILGKESGHKVTPQDYFKAYYADTPTSASSGWIAVDGKPVYYEHDVKTDPHILVNDYWYDLFTNDKIFIFAVKPGVLLNSITGQWQATTYEQKDDDLIKQIIGTLSFSDTSVKFVKASADISQTNWKTYASAQPGFSFKYPSDWEICKNPSGVNYVTVSTYCAYAGSGKPFDLKNYFEVRSMGDLDLANLKDGTLGSDTGWKTVTLDNSGLVPLRSRYYLSKNININAVGEDAGKRAILDGIAATFKLNP